MVSFGAGSITASARALLQPKRDFDCANGGLSQQQPMVQSKLSQRQKMTICCSIALACGGAGMIGFFIVGPLIKNAMVTSDMTNESHFQVSSKFMISHARPLSGPAAPGMTKTGGLAPPMAPIGAVPASMIPAVMSYENSQLSQLQTRVVELKHMLEKGQAHQPGEGMAMHDPPPVHSNTGLFSAFLAVLGMGMGGVIMHAISDNSNSAPARTRLAAVTMSADDTMETPALEVPVLDVRKIGDYGFDPLGLGSDETFVPFREAEVKHGRLAMLAAVAWPLQEILHPILVDAAKSSGFGGAKDILIETAGKSPSLLNGGLDQWEIAPTLGLAVFMASVLEKKNVNRRAAQGLKFNEYSKTEVPGDLRFDPLKVTRSLNREEKVDFLEKELLNGRVAMIAVLFYVLEEVVFQTPIVRFTPDLFRPIIFDEGFRSFLDGAFSGASMDGSIDGKAY